MRNVMMGFPLTSFEPGETKRLTLEVDNKTRLNRLIVSEKDAKSFIILSLSVQEIGEGGSSPEEMLTGPAPASVFSAFDNNMSFGAPRSLMIVLVVKSIAEEATPERVRKDRWARRLRVSRWPYRFAIVRWAKSWLRDCGIYERSFDKQNFAALLGGLRHE